MKKTSYILLILIFSGCGGSLNKSLTNFTAYYNTYYNAKQDFRAGLKQVEQQPVQINPDEPVRPHPDAPLAGSESFEAAVDNAAQILRRFSDSKWTDDALLLIGKSYYYLQEYYLAIQKFEELLAFSAQTPLKQQAVIWKARTLLDIGSYNQAVQFLEKQIANKELQWEPHYRAEARVLLARHLTALERYPEAAPLLENAIPALEGKSMRGRSYLLLGQLLQKTGDYIRAYQAYSNVERNFPGYEYTYWADIKRAEASRSAGNVDQAISIYNSMLADDKNFDRRGNIYFQLAQTYEAQNDFKKAEAMYKRILENRTNDSSRQLLDNTYYQLGRLYSEQYNNYELAAAYLDSSKSKTTRDITDKRENDRLATAFNRYVSLKNEIVNIDSLLRLGSLSEEALKKELAIIRQQREETIEESGNSVQQTNTLANTRRQDLYSDENLESAATQFGFLNYKNEQMVQRARLQFRAVWGDRPLADNWRIQETFSNVTEDEGEGKQGETDTGVKESVRGDYQAVESQINIKDIPRTQEAKDKLRNQQMNARYRLGSLFFLTMNQPDSAAYYYKKILEAPDNTDLKAQTVYSLYELYSLQEQPDSASKYKTRILNKYPDTRYAERIRRGAETVETQHFNKDATADLRQKAQPLLESLDATVPDTGRAEKLRTLALESRTSPMAPLLYYEATREFIRFAKWQDTTATAADSLDAASKTDQLSFSGEAWDRVREMLTRFIELFPEAPQRTQVETWLEVIQRPEQKAALPTCEQLNVDLVIVPGREAFIQSVSMPEKVKNMNLSGNIRYRFVIAKDGSVESYELLSKSTNLGIEEAYEQAIEKSLHFEPVLQNGNPVRVSCEVEFSIKQ